jgi:hypothetical protein
MIVLMMVGMAGKVQHVQRECHLVLQDRASGAQMEMAVLYPSVLATDLSSVMNSSV